MPVGAFLDGIRRVTAAPLLLLGLYAATLAATLPLGIAGSLHPGWRAALIAGAAGMVRAFGPGGPGLAEPLAGFTDVTGHSGPGEWSAGLAVTAIAAWTFLAGGALDRLARQRHVGTAGFLAACRHHFWPLTRLAVLAGGAYWLLFGGLLPWLFGGGPSAATYGPGNGSHTDPVRIALYGLFGAAAAAVGLLIDYARVRAVVEDRRSMLGALVAALRFVRRHALAVAGLWLLNTALLALVLAAWALSMPVSYAGGPPSWGPFAVGQVCLAARLFATLVSYASQTSIFQDRLAHPTYVARARAVRP